MKTVKLPVNTCALDALLIEGNTEGAHRGIWFYSPDVVAECVEVGDRVEFYRPNEAQPVAVGRVTEVIQAIHQYPKYCSRLNDQGFRWSDWDECPVCEGVGSVAVVDDADYIVECGECKGTGKTFEVVE